MKFIQLLILSGILLLLSCSISGQSNPTIFANFSYNSYSMDELKDLMNHELSGIIESGIPAEIVDLYPAQPALKIGMYFPINNYDETVSPSIGFLIQRGSTGSKIHYEDYSGELAIEQIVSFTSIGGSYQQVKHYSSGINLGFAISISYLFSKLSHAILFRINDEENKQNANFNSSSFGIEPEILTSYNLSRFNFGVTLSYMLYFRSTLEYDKVADTFLSSKGDKVKINWSGLRAGFYISFVI